MNIIVTKVDDNAVMGPSSPFRKTTWEPRINTIDKQTLMNKCFAFMSTLKNKNQRIINR